MKLRKLSTCGKPGQVDGAAGAAGLDREQQGREDQDRRDELRAAEGLLHRARARARATTRSVGQRAARPSTLGLGRARGSRSVVALEVLAGLGDEDVVEGRLDQVERLDQDPGLVERPDDRRDLGGAALELDQQLARPCSGSGRPKPRADLARACVGRAVGEPELEVRACRPRPSATPGVPSATIRPPSMIPTRSASWSASSRYWVVRKTVVPSSLSAATSSQIALRLTGSRPVVGSSRNSTRARGRAPRRGRAGGACRPSRCRPAGRRPGSARPGRAARRRGARPRRRSGRAASPAAGSARGRSSAGRAPPPAARRRSRGGPSAASVDDVVAGDPGAAAGRAQQRGQHPHRGRLAGAVRARGRRRSRPRRPRGRPRRRP